MPAVCIFCFHAASQRSDLRVSVAVHLDTLSLRGGIALAALTRFCLSHEKGFPRAVATIVHIVSPKKVPDTFLGDTIIIKIVTCRQAKDLSATNIIVLCGRSGSLIAIVIFNPESTTSFSISSGNPKYLVAMPSLIRHCVFGS